MADECFSLGAMLIWAVTLVGARFGDSVISYLKLKSNILGFFKHP